jgi:hypothetical protein
MSAIQQLLLAGGRPQVAYVIASNAQEAVLNVSTFPAYIPGFSDIKITINTGIYVWSDNVANPALTINGATSGDKITLVNRGFVMGKGGGYGVSGVYSGGPAISTTFPITIDNTYASAYIGGGGGASDVIVGGGGGAGGGAGFPAGWYQATGFGVTLNQTAPSAAGGAIGSVGANGGDCYNSVSGTGYGAAGGTAGGGGGGQASITYLNAKSSTQWQLSIGGGGGGGRVFPGTGGAGGSYLLNGSGATPEGHTGGAGGSANNTGSAASGGGVITGIGGGGGWGAYGYNMSSPGNVAYKGGNAVVLNGNSVVWVSGDTTRVYGVVA